MALKKIKMSSSSENGAAEAPAESQAATPPVPSPASEPTRSEAVEDAVNLLKMRVRKVASPLSSEAPASAQPETAAPAPAPAQHGSPATTGTPVEPAAGEVTPEAHGDAADRTTHLVRESPDGKLTAPAGAKLAIKKEAAAPAAAQKIPVIPGIPAGPKAAVKPAVTKGAPATPAAPETQPKADPAHAEKPKDGGGLAVKKTKLEMPPELATPPASPQVKKPRIAGGPSSASAGFAIALVLGANAMLTIIPLIKLFMTSGKFPSSQMIVSIFFPLVVIIMIASMKKAMLIIAGILMGLNAVIAVALVAARPAIGQLSVPGLNEMLPTVHMAAGAFLLLLGGLVLLTGHRVVQWVIALIFAAGGIAMPWMPLETLLPPELFAVAKTDENPATAPGDDADLNATTTANSDFTIKLPDNWKMVSASGATPKNGTTVATKPSYTFSLVDGTLTLLVTPESVADTVTLANYAAAKLAAFKGEAPDANGMVMDVPDRTERKRLFIIIEDDAVEMLIVAKMNVMYVLFCRGSREIVQAHRTELDKIFQSFLLN